MSDAWTTSSGLIQFGEATAEEIKTEIKEFFKKEGFVLEQDANGTYYMECDGPFDGKAVSEFMKQHIDDVEDFFADETDHSPGNNYVSLDFLKELRDDGD